MCHFVSLVWRQSHVNITAFRRLTRLPPLRAPLRSCPKQKTRNSSPEAKNSSLIQGTLAKQARKFHSKSVYRALRFRCIQMCSFDGSLHVNYYKLLYACQIQTHFQVGSFPICLEWTVQCSLTFELTDQRKTLPRLILKLLVDSSK